LLEGELEIYRQAAPVEHLVKERKTSRSIEEKVTLLKLKGTYGGLITTLKVASEAVQWVGEEVYFQEMKSPFTYITTSTCYMLSIRTAHLAKIPNDFISGL